MSHRTAILVSGWLLGFAAVAQGQEPLSRETVRAAWKERQEKVRTAQFKWKQTVFTVKGAYDSEREEVMRRGGKDPGPNPPEDHSFTSDCTLSIDGDRVVYQFTRRAWDADQRRYTDAPTEYKFDGEKQLSLNHPGWTPWSQALIRAEPRGSVLPPDARPVLRTLRGTNPKVRADDLDEYAPSGAALAIGDGRGRELISKGGPGRAERHLWIDPGRGFVALRYSDVVDARPYYQIEVKYKAAAIAGWVPTEWKIVQANMRDGRVKTTTTSTVTSYTINEPIDESTFAFTLPLDCRVTDETKSPREYIIRDDGSTRVMTGADIGKTYQEIVSTPGPSLVPGWQRWTGLILAAFVGLGILLLVARVLLVRKTNRQPLPPGHIT